MADTGDYERVILAKQEVFVYKIPPVQSNRGVRAADWGLDNPDWVGRLRAVTKGPILELKLEDKTSGELFAKAPIDSYPGTAIQSVLDSSRYFVVRLQDESGRSAFIGMGFADRGDSFDLNVALQDHFKGIQRDEVQAKEAATDDTRPKLDLSFKPGQSITLNIAGKGGSKPARSQASSGLGDPIPLLPPPPSGQGGSRGIPRPVSGASMKNSSQKQDTSSDFDDFDALRGKSASASASAGGKASAGLDSLLDL